MDATSSSDITHALGRGSCVETQEALAQGPSDPKERKALSATTRSQKQANILCLSHQPDCLSSVWEVWALCATGALIRLRLGRMLWSAACSVGSFELALSKGIELLAGREEQMGARMRSRTTPAVCGSVYLSLSPNHRGRPLFSLSKPKLGLHRPALTS